MNMWEEVSPEKEERIIDNVAKKIVKSEMVFPIQLLLGLFMPVVYITGQLGRVFLTSFDFLSLPFEYISVFEKRENIKKLNQRIDELAKERDVEKKEEKKEWWKRFFSF